MAIKFEKIQPNDVLLEVRRSRMGNTAMREWVEWRVHILSVDREKRTAIVTWNGNAPTEWREKRLRKLYRESPKCIRDQRERQERYACR